MDEDQFPDDMPEELKQIIRKLRESGAEVDARKLEFPDHPLSMPRIMPHEADEKHALTLYNIMTETAGGKLMAELEQFATNGEFEEAAWKLFWLGYVAGICDGGQMMLAKIAQRSEQMFGSIFDEEEDD